MRVFTLVTAALAASVLASAPVAAQVRAEVIQKACPDMTFNQIGKQLEDLVQKYEFSSDRDEAEQQAAGLLCPSPERSVQRQEQQPAQQPAAAQQAVVTFPPPSATTFPPPPRPRMMPPHVVIPRLPPPPPMYSRRPPPRAVVVGGGYQEQMYQDRPRALPLTKSARGEQFCLAERDPEAFAAKYPMPRGYARGACTIGPVPNMPCPGWVCQR